MQAFRSFEFFVCYYGWGDYRIRQNTCETKDAYKAFLFIVAVVPYWCRFLQVCCKASSIQPHNHTGMALKHIYGLHNQKEFIEFVVNSFFSYAITDTT